MKCPVCNKPIEREMVPFSDPGTCLGEFEAEVCHQIAKFSSPRKRRSRSKKQRRRPGSGGRKYLSRQEREVIPEK